MLSEFAGQPGPDRYWRSAGSLAALLPHSDRRGSASGGGSPHHRGAAKSGAALLGLLAIALLLACSVTVIRQSSELQATATHGYWGGKVPGGSGTSGRSRPADTLVMYVYSDSDPEYRRNLEFFAGFGMAADDGCDYVIVVQQGELFQNIPPLPVLPANARYEFHHNECFDWGTIGWLIHTGRVNTKAYKFFMFLNSSTRGPFLPAYWPKGLHWSRAFTGRITADVKLAGSTISCEATLKDGNPAKGSRQNAHVQSYAMATDQVGLNVLQEDGKVFECHKTIHDTVWHSELGASLAILQAGYNLDSLMVRYQGIDWRDPAYWSCNAGENPYKEASLDGTSLAPTEVLFVKVKGFLRDLGWTSALMAERQDHWLRHQGDASAVTANQYFVSLPDLKKKRAFEMSMRDANCFDVEEYVRRNPDLPPMSAVQLWSHFVLYGQFEGRPFRFLCGSKSAGSPQSSSKATGAAGGVTRAAASNVEPEQMLAAALQAAQQFEQMVPHPNGLASAVADFQAHGAEQNLRRAEERRQAEQAQRPRQSEVTPEPVQQPRRQAAERTHKPFGDDGKAQPPDAARTAAGPRAALALGLGSVAPAPGLLLPADAAPAAGAAAAGPGPGGSRAPLQATSSSPGAAGPATGASVAVGAVTGVEAAGAEGGAADAGASGKQRRAGGKKKKKKKKRNRQKTAEQMPDIAPTLFGADPQLKIGRGQAAGTSA